MRGVRYYRLMIALPAFGSLLAILLLVLLRGPTFMYGLFALLGAASHDSGSENTLGLLLLLVLLSPVTLACLVTLPVLLRRLRDQPEALYRRSSRRAPLWVGAATFVASSVFLLFLDFAPDVIFMALIVGVVSVVLGYVYVGLAAVLLGMLRAISLVEPIEDQAISKKD